MFLIVKYYPTKPLQYKLTNPILIMTYKSFFFIVFTVIKVRIKSVKMAVKKGFNANNLQQLPLPVLTSAERSYKVWVRDVYKGHQFISAGSHPDLYTSYYESMCGVGNLEVGKTYVIMGELFVIFSLI